jgi:PAS domain S-box-containing protein
VSYLKDYQKELAHVKEILSANPRGMTVTDISREININRNSVAKYLDVLLISGQVDMKRMGPAKAYFLSDRVPISAMLNFSSDCIMVFNSHIDMVQVNDVFLDLIDVERNNVVGRKWSEAPPGIFDDPDISTGLQNGLEGKDSTIDKLFHLRGKDLHFHIKFVPATFQDGSLGVTLIMENITERKHMEEALKQRGYELHERVKEMTCLYGISQLCDDAGNDTEEILKKAILQIPSAWQYPDITCARIKYEGRTFETPNFEETEWRQSADLDVFGGKVGSIEVSYLQEMPPSNEGPFTKEERALIEAIAQQLSKTIERIGYRERLEALHSHAINLALASNIEEIARNTLDAIEMVFSVLDIEFIIARDETLQLIDRKGPGTPVRTSVPFDEPGIITKAARTKRSVIVSDVRSDPDYFEARTKTLSELAVPVKINDDLLAILNLESPNEGAFTIEDQKLLEIFAGHVASAIMRIKES